MPATFVTCPRCNRLILGQRNDLGSLPQLHECEPDRWHADDT